MNIGQFISALLDLIIKTIIDFFFPYSEEVSEISDFLDDLFSIF